MRAQSGDALAHAERTCLDNGVGPYSATFDICTERSATAYDEGQPSLATAEAHRVAQATKLCMSYDLDPQTLGYHQRIAQQTDRPFYALRY